MLVSARVTGLLALKWNLTGRQPRGGEDLLQGGAVEGPFVSQVEDARAPCLAH